MKKLNKRTFWVILLVAAIIVIGIALLFVYYTFENKKIEQEIMSTEEILEVETNEQPVFNKTLKMEGNYFEVVKPGKTPYIIQCNNLSKSFDFQWNANNTEKMEVVIKDKKGRVLLAREVTEDGLKLKYEDYYKYLELYWELNATFVDGATERKQGVLQLLVDD